MALAFDATSEATAGIAPSWTHTPVGTPRGVLVGIMDTADADNVTGVTYGGVSMTEVSGSPLNVTGTAGIVLHLFFLGASIPTGAQTVTVSGSSTTKQAWACTVTADEDTEVQNTATADEESTTVSFNLALGGETCFCAEVWGTEKANAGLVNILLGSSWTPDDSHDFGSQVGGFYTYDTIGSTDVTAGFRITSGGAEFNGCIAVAIKESAGGGGGAVHRPLMMMGVG